MEHNNNPTGRATSVDAAVGAAIRERRIELGISQQQLSELIGVSYQQLYKYEHATNRVSSSKLWDIAKALKVKPGYFFEKLDCVTKDRDRGALQLMRDYHSMSASNQHLIRMNAAAMAQAAPQTFEGAAE